MSYTKYVVVSTAQPRKAATTPIRNSLKVVVRCLINSVWVRSKWLLAFQKVPASRGTTFTQTIFSQSCPLNVRRRAARSLFEIGHLFSLFSCLSLTLLRLLIFLLFLMSGNVYANPGPVFPCSVCAGNVTWRGRLVQCCTCSIWVPSFLDSEF